MTRGAGRRAACDDAFGDARLKQAEAFALSAGLDPLSDDGPTRSVAVSNAVLAGIAAADSICCRTLRKRSASGNHADAVDLLKQAPGKAPDAAVHLMILIGVKGMAQYEARNPSVSDTKRALRAMGALIRIARAI
ncbi:MAG: hypothetical protein F4X18_00215 [Acidimicrobiia bacterium]|nr:hypothetical protein [Acidimicrobiia bacterium]MYC83928.1 hypothetical protein [Acidimicrobiia bacterium]